MVRLCYVELVDVLDLDFWPVSQPDAVAGMSEYKECSEDKCCQQNRDHRNSALGRQLFAFPFYESGKACFGCVPHIIIYGTSDLGYFHFLGC